MTIDPRDLAASIDFLSQRFGLSGHRDERALSQAAEEANRLAAGDPDAEPAAVFYALSRRARALRDAWSLLPDLVALNRARAAGWTFAPEGVRALRVAVASGRVTFDDVAAWFASRRRPL